LAALSPFDRGNVKPRLLFTILSCYQSPLNCRFFERYFLQIPAFKRLSAVFSAECRVFSSGLKKDVVEVAVYSPNFFENIIFFIGLFVLVKVEN